MAALDNLPTVASQVKFSELCGLLEKIQRTQGNDKKKRVLKDFLNKWREFHQHLYKNDEDTMDSLYPAMRLLLPHLDKERVAYGIKEHTYAKLLIEVLCLSKDSPDANLLLHFKSPKMAQAEAGDFAAVAQCVLKNRCPDKGSLTIEDVNRDLDAIAIGNSNKDKATVRKNMIHLLTSLSATEQKWLIRMIMKELKIGLSQTSVLGVYHPDAEELYNVNNNLEKVCVLLRDPKTRAHEIGITLFLPFSPMLGERASPDKVEEIMDNKMYFIETKYDGERVLLHKDGNEYKYFSRSGKEYTQVFGSSMFEGTLTPHIANCFKPEVKKCILDGEMLGFHAASQTFGTKGEQFDIKSKDVEERSGYQPCIQVFDILLLNNKVLTNCPLKERLPLLEDIFSPVDGRILRSTYRPAHTNGDCADALNEAIDNKEEGIMVKLADSVYRPNTRKGGWFKIKPEYIGGLMDELDLLIVGGYFGVGHRGGLMSHFLCAVAACCADGEKPTVFYSFCKVGSGYSKKQLKDFNQQLAQYWQVYDKKNPPKHLELASGFKEKPDAWLPPEKSCIVQVKAAEIIDSDRFKVGYTLRFPRVELIREDKLWHQCMTTTDIEDLRQKSGGKLASSRFELGETDKRTKMKRKLITHAMRPTLMEQFQGIDVSKVKQVSKLLEGKEICVINGPAAYPKQKIEEKVAELGGMVVQHPDKSTLCVIAERSTVKVNNLIKNNKYDIVKADWLIKVVESMTWIPWSPRDMIHATPVTQNIFLQDFDLYGDSYTVDTTEEELQCVFHKMEKISPVCQEAVVTLEEEHFPDDSPYGLFRSCRCITKLYGLNLPSAYIDRFYTDRNLVLSDPDTHIPNCPLDLLQLELRFFGAILADTLDTNVSHVIVHESDLSRISAIKDIRRSRQKKFHIVKENWVRACLEEGFICQERTYEI